MTALIDFLLYAGVVTVGATMACTLVWLADLVWDAVRGRPTARPPSWTATQRKLMAAAMRKTMERLASGADPRRRRWW